MGHKITGKGQELYIQAKKVIPGGTQLLSKRPEMFLPDLWPAYYAKAKGCKIWDLDGKEYTDSLYRIYFVKCIFKIIYCAPLAIIAGFVR